MASHHYNCWPYRVTSLTSSLTARTATAPPMRRRLTLVALVLATGVCCVFVRGVCHALLLSKSNSKVKVVECSSKLISFSWFNYDGGIMLKQRNSGVYCIALMSGSRSGMNIVHGLWHSYLGLFVSQIDQRHESTVHERQLHRVRRQLAVS